MELLFEAETKMFEAVGSHNVHSSLTLKWIGIASANYNDSRNPAS